MEYLDFELPIKELEDQLDKCQIIGLESDVDVTNTCKQIEKKLEETKRKIYKNLTAWQRVQLSRHPNRPYTLEHITTLTKGTFLELFGDRNFKDDKAMIGGLGQIDGQSFMLIGQQKGINTKMRQYRNFGMANPEGYRKALRAAMIAEKFQIPILMLVDTPGAYPGLGAEERNQSEAIAKNLYEFANLTTPTVSVVIGEGGSGGALAISIADKLAMMRYSVYAVISPEGCSAILWNDPSKVETAAQALKITAENLKQQNLIDDVINEPLIGAHRNKDEAYMALKEYFLNSVEELKKLTPQERQEKKYQKIMNLGSFSE